MTDDLELRAIIREEIAAALDKTPRQVRDDAKRTREMLNTILDTPDERGPF